MIIRADLGTNIFVSGLISAGGSPRQIVDSWLTREFTLITSPYLIEELHHVLAYPRIASRLRLSDHELILFFDTLVSLAEVELDVKPLPGVTRDPKDDAVIACAFASQADYVVSGDQDILVLSEYEGTRMIAPVDFLSILTQSGSLSDS